jgi:hypothetical protein
LSKKKGKSQRRKNEMRLKRDQKYRSWLYEAREGTVPDLVAAQQKDSFIGCFNFFLELSASPKAGLEKESYLISLLFVL